MTIRAILFDLGNTLLEYGLHGQWGEFLRRRLEEMYPLVGKLVGSIVTSPDEFGAQLAEIIGGDGPRKIERGGRSWHFGERLREALAAAGLSADRQALDRLTDEFYQPIRACTRPYPETRETLERLRAQQMPMAIITNSPWDTPAQLLRGDLEQWGLADYFRALICSGEVPWRKPNPLFMLAAAEALGAAAGECLVVGDTLEVDIAGAQAAGMRSVWISRGAAPVPPEAPNPTWTATRLTEVAEITAAEGARA
jgi:HAD superfamily hydrolase (TIGR01509 family)